jgi:hypothetical protein
MESVVLFKFFETVILVFAEAVALITYIRKALGLYLAQDTDCPG